MNPLTRYEIAKGRLLEISLILVALTLPFHNIWNSYSIVAFCVLAIFSNSIHEKVNHLSSDLLSWLLPGLYFLCVAVFYFLDRGSRRTSVILETNASLIALPVILGSMRKLPEGTLKRIMISFVFSNIAGSLYCLFEAYIDYKANEHYINLFFYHHLSQHIGINAIYYSMFCLFSLIILLYYFFLKKASRLSQILAWLTIFYLTFLIILLSSKMFIFLLGFSGLAVFVYSYIRFRKLKLGLLAILLVCLSIPVLLSKIPYAKTRIEYTQIKRYGGVEDNNNGLAVRGVLWESTWELIREEHFLLGHGHFVAQDALRKRYAEAGFTDGVEKNYNTHNQYLYTWACYGLIGLLTLLLFIFRFFLLTIKRRTFLGILLSVLFICANFTECMFETQKGLVFFLFFSGLILIEKNNEIQPSKKA
jgi:O-antigen ligase